MAGWKMPCVKVSVITYYFGCEHEGRGKKMVSRKIREE
jgi:hypothetical protein